MFGDITVCQATPHPSHPHIILLTYSVPSFPFDAFDAFNKYLSTYIVGLASFLYHREYSSIQNAYFIVMLVLTVGVSMSTRVYAGRTTNCRIKNEKEIQNTFLFRFFFRLIVDKWHGIPRGMWIHIVPTLLLLLLSLSMLFSIVKYKSNLRDGFFPLPPLFALAGIHKRWHRIDRNDCKWLYVYCIYLHTHLSAPAAVAEDWVWMMVCVYSLFIPFLPQSARASSVHTSLTHNEQWTLTEIYIGHNIRRVRIRRKGCTAMVQRPHADYVLRDTYIDTNTFGEQRQQTPHAKQAFAYARIPNILPPRPSSQHFACAHTQPRTHKAQSSTAGTASVKRR